MMIDKRARSFEFDSMFVTFSTKHDALSMTMNDLVILDVSGVFSLTVLALQSSWTLRKLVLTVTSSILVDTDTNAERRREDYVAHNESLRDVPVQRDILIRC